MAGRRPRSGVTTAVDHGRSDVVCRHRQRGVGMAEAGRDRHQRQRAVQHEASGVGRQPVLDTQRIEGRAQQRGVGHHPGGQHDDGGVGDPGCFGRHRGAEVPLVADDQVRSPVPDHADQPGGACTSRAPGEPVLEGLALGRPVEGDQGSPFVCGQQGGPPAGQDGHPVGRHLGGDLGQHRLLTRVGHLMPPSDQLAGERQRRTEVSGAAGKGEEETHDRAVPVQLGFRRSAGPGPPASW
jgi:hypothetical protein